MGGVLFEIGKAIGKAVIAGLGVELARVTSAHMRKKLGVKDDDVEKVESDLEKMKRENEALRRELDALKAERNKPA